MYNSLTAKNIGKVHLLSDRRTETRVGSALQ